MKLSDVWDGTNGAKIEVIKSYIADHCLALELFKCKVLAQESNTLNNSFQTIINKFVAYSIGQVVTYVVTKITNEAIEVKINLTGSKTEPTVSGLAVKYTNFDELSEAHMGNAIICDFDFDRKLILVYIQPYPSKIVRQVKNSSKFDLEKNVKIGQLIKGTVIFIGPRYVLVVLGGHVPGLIAYVPSRRHQNDLGQIEKLYTIGQDYHFNIQHTNASGQIIAVLNTESKKNNKNQKKSKFESPILKNVNKHFQHEAKLKNESNKMEILYEVDTPIENQLKNKQKIRFAINFLSDY